MDCGYGGYPGGQGTIAFHLLKYLEYCEDTVLEDLVKSEPDNIPLRARLAQLDLNLERRGKALEHLDVLGDLQLEMGHRDAATKTIEAIMALNPPNREAYADLYREMTNNEPPPP